MNGLYLECEDQDDGAGVNWKVGLKWMYFVSLTKITRD